MTGLNRNSEFGRMRDHIAYELDMLGRMNALLAEEHGPLKNATVESFLVHARLLSEFLFRKANSGYPDNVYAWRFFARPRDHTKWFGSLSAETKGCLTSLFSEASKRVAHLSTTRTKTGPELEGWDHNSITREVCRAYASLLDAMPDETRDLLPDLTHPWAPGQSSGSRLFRTLSMSSTTYSKGVDVVYIPPAEPDDSGAG